MREKELKPCPFCGGKSELWESKASNGYLYGYAIRCVMCKSRTKIYKEIEYATDAWNRRADNGKL